MKYVKRISINFLFLLSVLCFLLTSHLGGVDYLGL